MVRTYNRQPKFVDTPSASSIKTYTLNIASWKGINDDQNYVQVDQETFADATNVIVDEDNILRSRPSIKPLKFDDWAAFLGGPPYYVKRFEYTNVTVPSYDMEEWRPELLMGISYVDVFGDVLVFFERSTHLLYFLDKSNSYVSCISVGQSDIKITIIDESNKLFVFNNSRDEEKQQFYYDLNDGMIHNSDTRVVKVVYEPNQHEEKNLLYSGNVYTYKLWSGTTEKEIKELQGFDFSYHLKSGDADYEVVVSKGETDLLHLPSIFYSIEESVYWKPVFYSENLWARIYNDNTVHIFKNGSNITVVHPYMIFRYSKGIQFTNNGDALILYAYDFEINNYFKAMICVLSLSDIESGFILIDSIIDYGADVFPDDYDVPFGEKLVNGDFTDFSNGKLTGTWYSNRSVHVLREGNLIGSLVLPFKSYFSPFTRLGPNSFDIAVDSNNRYDSGLKNLISVDNYSQTNKDITGLTCAVPFTFLYDDFYVKHFDDCSVLIGVILDMDSIIESIINTTQINKPRTSFNTKVYFCPILLYNSNNEYVDIDYAIYGGVLLDRTTLRQNNTQYGYSFNVAFRGSNDSDIYAPTGLSMLSEKDSQSVIFPFPSELNFNIKIGKYTSVNSHDSDEWFINAGNVKMTVYYEVICRTNKYNSMDKQVVRIANKFFTYCQNRISKNALGLISPSTYSDREGLLGYSKDESFINNKTDYDITIKLLDYLYEEHFGNLDDMFFKGISTILRLNSFQHFNIRIISPSAYLLQNSLVVTSSYVSVSNTIDNDKEIILYPGFRNYNNNNNNNFKDIKILFIDGRNILFNFLEDTRITINDTIYQTKLPDNPEDAIDIKIKGNGEFVQQDLSINTYLDGYWFAIGNKVYRNKYTVDENGNWQLYIPENNYEEFETDVTGLMTISTDTVAAFTDNAVYTSTIVGQDENGNNIYGKFIKSKFNLGNKSFSDILTTYDGKYTLFNTMRGLAGMSFQDFINSTDQALTFLSEPIYSQYFEFVKKPVLMTLYKYWLYCYHSDDTIIWILDFRTSSWWKYEVNKPIQKIIIYNDGIYFLQSGGLCHFDYNTDYYYDEYRDVENSASPDFIEHSQINWSLTSQKLYLGSIDRYKTVKDITIYNVQDDERDINFVLDCKNYRHHIDDGKEEWIEYNVSKIRTFVKRLHYSKVREFQYTLRNDPNAQVQSPMKISNIAIKYHVGDEVR